MLVNNYVQETGILVIDPSSPEFEPQVQKLLGSEALAKASSFLPSSIVLINNTKQYIWGFTVVYTYPDWTSPAGTAWKHRISPSAAGPADRNAMLSPGAAFLITPVSSFLASRDASGRRILQPPLDEGMDRMIEQFLSNQGGKRGRVEVSVDSVIFEDGAMVGPDAEGMMTRINERIRTEKDLIAAIGNLKGESLKHKLTVYSGKTSTDEYSAHMRGRAQAILRFFNDQGESAAATLITTLRNSKWFQSGDGVRRKEQ